ncbi:MAG: hypothetical protein IKJ65_09530 [Clostridia bacterium]|nr:hypothetical protein [Clostridia bacterium]
MEKKLNDVSISGSGKVTGGEYGNVRVSGSGRITGNIIAKSIHVSGSAHAAGVEAEEIRASGSFRAEGEVKAKSIHVSGSGRIDGAIEAGDIHVSGAFHAGSVISAGEIHASGSIHAESGVEADKVILSGGANIKGLLNAEEIDIRLGGSCIIGEIGGEHIRVQKGNHRINFTFSVFNFGKRYSNWTLQTNSIEGTEVLLENTICPIVRAKNAVIGEGCEIQRIEYEETLQIHPSAIVKEQIKI